MSQTTPSDHRSGRTSPTTRHVLWRKIVGGVAAVGLAASMLAATTAPAQAASPDKLPLSVTNDTGRSGSVFLYILGVDLESGKLGYVDKSGEFTAWSLPGGDVPVAAPDVSIPGPTNGESVDLKIPKNLSGRVYFAFDDKLDFGLVNAGLVQPAPWNPSDKNADNLFDWSEFTFNSYGLWLNSSQVDQFAAPHEVNVTSGDGSFSKTGLMVDGGRDKVINAVKANPDFAKSVITKGDEVLRVLNPSKAVDAKLMDENYLDDYIDEAWAAYSSKKLTVVPFDHEPETKFFGTTSGNSMSFTDTTGKQVATFAKPSTADVWDCDGNIQAPNDHVVGPIARTLCAALHRGTLGDSTQEPVKDNSKFYQRDLTNHFSKIVHANMVDKKAYGFAFDDVTAQESLVHSGDPQKAGIVLDPFK